MYQHSKHIGRSIHLQNLKKNHQKYYIIEIGCNKYDITTNTLITDLK